jgi:hypothetical protein
MNERIRQLAEQAGFQYIKDEGIGWAGNYNNSLPKFAELIVQECLLSLEPDPMAPAINYDVEEKFYKRSADKIKKHFGVEI